MTHASNTYDKRQCEGFIHSVREFEGVDERDRGRGGPIASAYVACTNHPLLSSSDMFTCSKHGSTWQYYPVAGTN
jgi:hypothetical protein